MKNLHLTFLCDQFNMIEHESTKCILIVQKISMQISKVTDHEIIVHKPNVCRFNIQLSEIFPILSDNVNI